VKLHRLLLGCLLPAHQLIAAKPNIIVVYTDDQGFGDASCLNPDLHQWPSADSVFETDYHTGNCLAITDGKWKLIFRGGGH